MKDLQDILTAYDLLNGQPAALATVVKTRGSSYRKPGARMLIRTDGTMVGALSGGCLENDVATKAANLINTERSELAVFDMTTPDDDLWGYGQGCNGVIFVFIEPLGGAKNPDPFSVFDDAINRRRSSVLVTVFRTEGEIRVPLGARVALSDNGTVKENVRHPVLTSALVEQAELALREGTTRCREIRLTEGMVEVLVEIIQPPVFLVIAGGGTDAIPVHRIAKELGWQVCVTDHRPAFATKERFPFADRTLVRTPEELSGEISVDHRTAVVIMTHHFEHDLALLLHFARTPVPYIGLLGPAKRSELLLQRLEEQGPALNNEQRSRLHSPVGLNIGAEAPEEIALAIIGEIQTVLTGHRGGFMRDKRGSIHGS
ncbi:MAG: XdhC family protein [Ignavibacteriales bacterium]|nr:XdhC family protein [Ignavibacteriales bacterium]